MARVPRDGGEDARESLEGDPARVQEAREPGPHVGCRVPFPRRDRRAGQKTARQRRDGRTAEGRRAHRLPLRQDISEIRDRRIGIPLCAGRHGRVVGRRVRRLSRTPPLLRIRVPQLPRAGQPRLFDRQLAQETGEHGALQARFHRGQLSGLRDVPRQVAVRHRRDGGHDLRPERPRNPGADLRGDGRAGAGLRPLGAGHADAPGRRGTPAGQGRNGKYIGKPESAVVNCCPTDTIYDIRE